MISTMPTLHNDELDLIAFLRVLWDLKFVVLITTVLFGLGSIYIAFTATPIYRAEVVVAKAGDAGMSSAASLAGQLGGLVGVNLDRKSVV